MKKRIAITFLVAVLMLTVAIFAASCKKTGNKITPNIVAPTIEQVVVTRKNSAYVDTENTLCLKLDGAICEPVIVTLHFNNNSNYDIYSVKINSKDYDKSSFKSGFSPKKVAVEVSPLFKEAGDYTFEVTSVSYSTNSKIYATPVSATIPVRVAPQFSLTLDMSQTIYATDKQIEVLDNVDFMSFLELPSDNRMTSSSVQPEGYGFVGWYASPEPNVTKDKRFAPTDAYEFFADITLYAVYECLFTYNADVATGTTTITGLTSTGKKQPMIIIPDELGGYPIRYIGQSAFVGTTVSSVVCNSGLIGIGARAFQNCTALASISFNEGLVEIGMLAFSRCTKLNSMSLFPTSLTTIGTKAFEYCGWKTNIGVVGHQDTLILPNTLVSVGDACFQYSTFKVVYFEDYGDANPPAEVSFGKQLLYSSSKLETVKTGVQVNRDTSNSFENKSNGLRKIPDEAFQYCKNLKSVTLIEGLESIGSYAFFCTSGTMENFKTIELPNSLKEIASYSFGNVPLTALNFKSTNPDPAQNTSKLTSIGDYAFQVSKLSGRLNLYAPHLINYGASPFWGSLGITSIFLYTNIAPYFKTSNTNQVQNLNPRIKYYVPKSKLDNFGSEWVVNFSLVGLGTTYKPLIYALEDVTQDDKYSYTKAYDPINDEYYIALTNIFDDEGTTITVADTMSVVGLSGNTEVLPIKKIGSYVAGKTITSVFFDKPENIIEISANAFAGSSALVNFCKEGSGSRFTDFTSLIEIGENAFSGTAITRFEAPDSLRYIRNSAFFGAKHLNFAAVKGALSDSNSLLLDVQAFYGCSALDTVVLGSRVNSIGSSAFGNCNNLGTLVMEHSTLPNLPTGSVAARGILGTYNGVTTIFANEDLINYVNSIGSGGDLITYRDYRYALGYWDWEFGGGVCKLNFGCE